MSLSSSFAVGVPFAAPELLASPSPWPLGVFESFGAAPSFVSFGGSAFGFGFGLDRIGLHVLSSAYKIRLRDVLSGWNMSSFERVVERLSMTYHLLRFDLWGCGGWVVVQLHRLRRVEESFVPLALLLQATLHFVHVRLLQVVVLFILLESTAQWECIQFKQFKFSSWKQQTPAS